MRKRIAIAVAASLAATSGAAAIGLGASSSGAATRSTSGLDEQYLKTSAEGDAFEIQGARLALRRSGDRRVRKLAHVLLRDHRKSLKETESLAKQLGVKVDAKPSPTEAWELDVVRTSDGWFNHWYATLEVQDHKVDIEDASMEANRGSNSRVRKSARKEIPTLRYHLKLSRRAAR